MPVIPVADSLITSPPYHAMFKVEADIMHGEFDCFRPGFLPAENLSSVARVWKQITDAG